jgi:hypothetical protein
MKPWQALTLITLAAAIGMGLVGGILAILIAFNIFVPDLVVQSGYQDGGIGPALFVLIFSIAFSILLVNLQQALANFMVKRNLNKLRIMYQEIENSSGTKAANEWLIAKLKNEMPDKSIGESLFIDKEDRRLIDELRGL